MISTEHGGGIMPRIKIHDLPENQKLGPEEIRKITGGFHPSMVKMKRERETSSWLTNPWVLSAIVHGAIAVPLGVDDDDEGA
jgi:hypothetical protein